MAVTAARPVAPLAANLEGGCVVGSRDAILCESLGEARTRATFTPCRSLHDFVCERKKKRGGCERLASEVEVDACRDYIAPELEDILNDLREASVEELNFVDADDFRTFLENVLKHALGLLRRDERGTHAEAVLRYCRRAAPSRILRWLEENDTLPPVLFEDAHLVYEISGFSREHRARNEGEFSALHRDLLSKGY